MPLYPSLTDYHVHTGRYHAVGRPEEYVEQAIRLGLAEIGFSEHAPLYHLPVAARDPDLAMPDEAVEGYVAEILGLRARYPEITIRLGVEADYIPGQEATLAKLLAPYPWDYVLGSVHFFGDWGIDNPGEVHRYADWDIDELYHRYLALVVDAAETGLFDVMSHLDLVKKFGHRSKGDLAALYCDVAARIGRSGVAIEVSTAGLRKPAAEIYPAPALLAECHRIGVPVQINSDAHAPDEVGRDFDRAVTLLRQVGYREVVRFAGRQRTGHLL